MDAEPVEHSPDGGSVPEHLDVLIVGAGLSGICAAHHVATSSPWADFAVFEARDSIGGTWDLFRYPGVRSDSDMFTLGYSFRPWQRPEGIAEGGKILQYIKDTAAEDGTLERIRFGHRIVSASWSSDDARWTIVADRYAPGAQPGDTPLEQITLTCSFLFSCSGYYRYDRGHQPEFPGIGDYEGTVVHPQFWPEEFDVTGKKVVVIGSGATAVTLVPSLAKDAELVTMLQRSPTYIASLPAINPVTTAIRKVVPTRWRGAAMKWLYAMGTLGSYQLSRRRPELMKRILRKGLERELPEGFDIDTHFTPTYDPWDQRLCLVPDGDLFKAIKGGRADVVTGHIDTFTPKGVMLTSGEELQADVIVTATGLEVLFLGGIELTVDGEPVPVSERLTYKGMMLEGVPNLALAIGYTNASWTLRAELICQQVVKLLNDMRTHGDDIVTPVSDGAAGDPEPLLGLQAGYVLRAADRMPRQGAAAPWRVTQNYFLDYRAMRLRPVRDEGLRFQRRGRQNRRAA